MKRIALFFAALMILSFGLANAQDAITASWSGLWNDAGTDKLTPGPTTITFTLTVATANVTGSTNGFEVYEQGGGAFTTAVGTFPAFAGYDGGAFVSPFSCDGLGADTVGFGGFAIFGTGIPIGPPTVYWSIATGATAGQTLCVDTAYYPPGGVWLWSTNSGDVYPSWNNSQGPMCYLVEAAPDPCPFFTNCPGVALSFNHCVTATYDFNASDTGLGAGPVTFEMVSGIGSIDPNSGMWSYSASLADVGPVHTVVVGVRDLNNCLTQCSFDVSFTNVAPTIACQGPVPVGKGLSVDVAITGNKVDCDNGTFSIVGVAPVPVGTYSIDPNTGVLTFNTDNLDGGISFTFTVEYSDGQLGAQCNQVIDVLNVVPYAIGIEKTHNTYQGSHEYVDVTITDGSEALWGFDILMAYDASALSFQAAIPGDVYTECGWEYFTYRYGADGNCNGGCPSGLLRVVGIAETNNGANHPSCLVGGVMTNPALPFTLFTLDFLVTDDRTFECMYVPIRFFWLDCGDNGISYHPSDDVANPYSQTLGISRFVYEGSFDPEYAMEVSDGAAVFPTYQGAPDICLEGDKDVPVRFVDFYNGGIDIVCADSIDARGDLNMNGTGYEIADAVLYSNYFVFGIGVFDYYQAQVAASDVNADGIPLSVADLVYLIRVVVGDALPYPKVAPVTAEVSYDGSIISVNERMGAAYVVVEGNATPSLLIEGVEMKYAYDAAENVTRVLVVGMVKDAAIEGTFLNAGGDIVSVEMATYEGAPVSAKLIPTNFVLEQNYPNPFNPKTNIRFSLPTASEYTITVYNVTGQVVETISGRSDAGQVNVEFNASHLSSGIYFYNVAAGNFSDTKKMVLIK